MDRDEDILRSRWLDQEQHIQKKQFLTFQWLICLMITGAKLNVLHLDVKIRQAQQDLIRSIHPLYESREAKTIANWIMEELTGMGRSEMLIRQEDELNEIQEKKLEQYTLELLHGRPVQYVLSNAWFRGMPFFVDERVLIPRPETEELVSLIQSMYSGVEKNLNISLLDIGTGSGCIAIALKKHMPDMTVWGIDNSDGALEVAKLNAKALHAEIIFDKKNILIPAEYDDLPVFDIMVSNPPYIPNNDKKDMDKVVLNHEPHEALFVSDEDPLVFYEAILESSTFHLARGGMIFFETHAAFAQKVADLMESFEFEQVEIKNDLYGKDRIVYGRKSGASL